MKLKIISDGTNTGTKLIDEDTGESVPLIQKITWEVSNDGFMLTKATVELLNVPVEIVAKADVDLMRVWPEPGNIKTFEKEIKIVSEAQKGLPPKTIILDNATQEPVSAVQEVKWEATPQDRRAKVKKIKFDKKDW